MSQTLPERIVCEACGRSGPYRPEFAGHRIQCKCGHIMQAPTPAEAASPAQHDEAASEYAPPQDSLEQDAPQEDAPPEEAPAIQADMVTHKIRERLIEREEADKKSGVWRWIILVIVTVLVALGAVLGSKYFSKYFALRAPGPAAQQEAPDRSGSAAFHD